MPDNTWTRNARGISSAGGPGNAPFDPYAPQAGPSPISLYAPPEPPPPARKRRTAKDAGDALAKMQLMSPAEIDQDADARRAKQERSLASRRV